MSYLLYLGDMDSRDIVTTVVRSVGERESERWLMPGARATSRRPLANYKEFRFRVAGDP